MPVRGGSKSITLKNIKLINGRPLVYWTIDAAVNCKWIDEVYVSTDSEVIKDVVFKYDKEHLGKLQLINRSIETATDTASTESVMLEFANRVISDTIVLLQATSPLTESKHLDEAFQKYVDDEIDSLLTVVNQKRFIWSKEGQPINYNPSARPRRQDFEGYFVENGAFYITKTLLLLESKNRLSGNIGVYEMPEETYFEIDEPTDWIIVEKLLEKRTRKVADLEKIKLFATDCDGVLTDAGMYYTEDGDVMKKFNTKDGMGFSLLKEKGIITAILTGEESQIVAKRAEKLKIDEVFLGCKDKVAAMNELLQKYQLTMDEVAYIGDDLNDLPLLKQVGYSFAVADAIEQVKREVHYVIDCTGGHGAVREAIEYLLDSRE
ncbi:HAD-IIIA family hydrolase [Lysinibacillus sp. 1 U-2021]|uniref:acylneuraminate cytidylyltransferase n=1 Tax=Lysinibacillus sp. 1 U-2021 TaxID=3039426 RepID=UPI0024818404|nr:acylneuraminate cytidylyltransferase [Lysinibacillus sp. 1 U-2021]WGT41684.1 HAD-IIIA family hydrolase [Lysinibacillus sp. 1 U-2021]